MNGILKSVFFATMFALTVDLYGVKGDLLIKPEETLASEFLPVRVPAKIVKRSIGKSRGVEQDTLARIPNPYELWAVIEREAPEWTKSSQNRESGEDDIVGKTVAALGTPNNDEEAKGVDMSKDAEVTEAVEVIQGGEVGDTTEDSQAADGTEGVEEGSDVTSGSPGVEATTGSDGGDATLGNRGAKGKEHGEGGDVTVGSEGTDGTERGEVGDTTGGIVGSGGGDTTEGAGAGGGEKALNSVIVEVSESAELTEGSAQNVRFELTKDVEVTDGEDAKDEKNRRDNFFNFF